MFLGLNLLDWIVIEVNRRMTYFLEFMGENDLLGLFARARIKAYFPLERPVANFP